MTRGFKAAFLGASLLALSACATSGTGEKPSLGLKGVTASKEQNKPRLNKDLGVIPGGQNPEGLDPIAKAAFWGTRYDRDPKNANAAVKFSEALRDMGSNEESLSVIQKLADSQPDNAEVNLEFGKSLIANDRAFEAVRPLEKAIARENGQNWKSYSAYGVALDKIGQHKAARKQYDIALKIQPTAFSVMNNKGLSYALSGNLDLAERTLREAASNPSGTARVRQNLALVLGFKGETREAERLARSDLPPRVADNNTAYFRSLVAQPTYWQNFDSSNADLPDFDAPAAAATAPVETLPLTPPAALQQPEPAIEEPTVEQPAPQPEPQGEVLSSLPQPATRTVPVVPGLAGFGTDEWGSQTFSAPVAKGAPVELDTVSAEEKKQKSDVDEDDTGA